MGAEIYAQLNDHLCQISLSLRNQSADWLWRPSAKRAEVLLGCNPHIAMQSIARLFEPQGERIPTPVCALARNDVENRNCSYK